MRKIILLLGGILIGMISGCGNSESQWVITNNGNRVFRINKKTGETYILKEGEWRFIDEKMDIGKEPIPSVVRTKRAATNTELSEFECKGRFTGNRFGVDVYNWNGGCLLKELTIWISITNAAGIVDGPREYTEQLEVLPRKKGYVSIDVYEVPKHGESYKWGISRACVVDAVGSELVKGGESFAESKAKAKVYNDEVRKALDQRSERRNDFRNRLERFEAEMRNLCKEYDLGRLFPRIRTDSRKLEYLTLAYNTFLSKEYSTNRIYIVKVGGNNCVPVNESKVDEFVDDVWKNGDQERILIQAKIRGRDGTEMWVNEDEISSFAKKLKSGDLVISNFINASNFSVEIKNAMKQKYDR